MFPLIDTHCHFAESSFADDDILQARKRGLVQALVCATHSGDFEAVQRTACKLQFGYALGIHPLLLQTPEQVAQEVRSLEVAISEAQKDPLLCAVGEIGIDLYPQACTLPLDSQLELFEHMLTIAVKAGLPVSVHSRKALQHVLPLLKHSRVSGVLHAFAGSYEQAQQALAMGFKLGFGPSLTYPGSKRIREMFAKLPEDAFVLETDAPFMLTANRRAQGVQIARAVDLFEVLEAAAQIRGLSLEETSALSTRNAHAAFTRLAASCFPRAVSCRDLCSCRPVVFSLHHRAGVFLHGKLLLSSPLFRSIFHV